MNLREAILAVNDIPSEELHVKEWDVTVLVKGMSAGERITLMQNAYDQQTQQVNMAAVYPDVVVSCVHDPESGDAIFTPADKEVLMSKSSAAIESIAEVGLRLSGIGSTEQDDAGKDSSSTQSDDSSLS